MSSARLIQLPVQRREALISETSINEADRTIEITWTTGARRVTWSWAEQGLIEEELDLAGADLSRLNSGAPFLKDHDSGSVDNVLGVHVDGSVSVDPVAKVGRAKIQLSRRAAVEPYWQDIRDRILRQTSVGYSVDTYEVERAAGRLPLYRATRWQPVENSLVTIGADPGAQVRHGLQDATPCTIITRGASVAPLPAENNLMMPDDKKQSARDILKAAGLAEDQIEAAVEKLAALWPEEAKPAEGDMSEAARALGIEGEATPAALTSAAKNLRALYDAKSAELDARTKEVEESEFEVNEKKGLHRKLEQTSKGFARALYDSNKALYRSEVGKQKPLDARAPQAAPEQRTTVAKLERSSDQAERDVLARRDALLKANPKLTEADAYRAAFREYQASARGA
jgi:hypothetical protein